MESVYRVDRQSVEYLKKAVQSALSLNENPRDVHNRLIDIYWRLYNDLQEEIYFRLAFEHITAYIDAGYKPGDLSPNTEAVLEKAGYKSLCDYLHALHYCRDRYYIRLTRSRIKKLLGKGSVAKATAGVTKDTIVDEIFAKIAKREIGIHTYQVFYKDKIYLSHLIIENEKDVFMQDNEGNQFKFMELPPIAAK